MACPLLWAATKSWETGRAIDGLCTAIEAATSMRKTLGVKCNGTSCFVADQRERSCRSARVLECRYTRWLHRDRVTWPDTTTASARRSVARDPQQQQPETRTADVIVCCRVPDNVWGDDQRQTRWRRRWRHRRTASRRAHDRWRHWHAELVWRHRRGGEKRNVGIRSQFIAAAAHWCRHKPGGPGNVHLLSS